MSRSLIFAFVLASFATLNCAAQSSQSGSDSSSAKPAPQPAPAAAAKDPNTGKDPTKEKKKTKKVWTEEEISAVGGSISVVGDQHTSSNSSRTPASPSSSSSASEGRDAAYYRGRLAPLRQQIDDVNREIQELKSVKGTVRENLEAQVQIREARREKIQKQINEIEEDARQHGIGAGQLR